MLHPPLPFLAQVLEADWIKTDRSDDVELLVAQARYTRRLASGLLATECRLPLGLGQFEALAVSQGWVDRRPWVQWRFFCPVASFCWTGSERLGALSFVRSWG